MRMSKKHNAKPNAPKLKTSISASFNKSPSVRFIIPYFGPWPKWLPLFLESCRLNPGFNWILFGDHKWTKSKPQNVTFEKVTLNYFNQLAKKQTGLPFNIKTPYKICDARPMFGIIFQKYLNGWDFWGHTDLDIVYGNLASFKIKEILRSCDVYSPYDSIAGHFAIYKNIKRINRLYLKLEGLDKAYANSFGWLSFDEKKITHLLRHTKDIRFKHVNYKHELAQKKCQTGASILHGGQIIGEKPTCTEQYFFENGKTFQIKGKYIREFMYFHFFAWKKEFFWRHFDASQQVPTKFWVDLSGFTANKDELFSTNILARNIRLFVIFLKLLQRSPPWIFKLYLKHSSALLNRLKIHSG